MTLIDLLILGGLLVIIIFLPPLLDGVERKIRALVHSRIGPPIMQTWYDIIKLFGKTSLSPYGSTHIVIFTVIYLIMLFTTIALFLVASYYDDLGCLIASIALFTIVQSLAIALPFMTSNPYAVVGISREIMIMIVNETAFIIAFGLILYFTRGSYEPTLYYIILLAALLISSYVSSGRLPYDLAEAEPELASGILVEFSGPILGIYYYTNLVKRFFVKMVPVYFILMPLNIAPFYVTLLMIPLSCILWVIYATLAPLLGRSRIDIAPISLLKVYAPIFMLSIILFIVNM